MKKLLIVLLLPLYLWGDIEVYFQEDEIEYVPKHLFSVEFMMGTISRSEANIDEKVTIHDRAIKSTGFKIGAEDMGLRLFFSYRPMEIDNVFTYSYGVELDSMIVTESIWRLFYGIHLGGLKYSFDKNDDSTAPYYGFELGIIAEIFENYDLEVGARYSLTHPDNSSISTAYVVDEVLNYYFAVNFKY
jgi:hypothetical protein